MYGPRTAASCGPISMKIHISSFPLELMRTPGFLIDRSLRVVKSNMRGANLVAGKRAPATINAGLLRLRCPLAHDQLGALVSCFFKTDAEDADRFVKPSMFLRLLRSDDDDVALLSVRVASHQLKEVSAASVAKAFDLSVMQSGLAVWLVNGGSVERFALMSGITERTGKHHLNLLMKKFECRSRVELVRKLCILIL